MSPLVLISSSSCPILVVVQLLVVHDVIMYLNVHKLMWYCLVYVCVHVRVCVCVCVCVCVRVCVWFATY